MPEHYYTKKPLSKEKNYSISYRGLRFTTSSGVFGKSKFDIGSRILVDSCIINGRNVLDLGCGYGIIGIILAKRYPEVNFTLTDINERAVKLAKENIKKNNIANAKAFQSDGFEKIKDKFDVILLNPPQSAGKDVCKNLIKESKKHLNSNGTLQVVVRRNKGGKIIENIMQEIFGNVDVITKKSGYWVYISKNL